jgi:hypothetical protein
MECLLDHQETDIPLGPHRIAGAKFAYTTRFVGSRIKFDPNGWSLLSERTTVPRVGDVVLARVEKLGQHPRIELPDGRRAALFVGDEILVAYGNRYAPDQFDAELPGDLGQAHLVAAGGVAGQTLSAHDSMSAPTQIRPLGLLCDSSGVVELSRYAPHALSIAPGAVPKPGPVVIAVVGTSMNSGKSTTVAAIVRGLKAANLVVHAGKVTGTGAGGDPQLFRESGADLVLDFTDFGFPSTYLADDADVKNLFLSLVKSLNRGQPSVVEIADGIFQRETAALLATSEFQNGVDHVVFSAGDATSALAGTEILARNGLWPVAISGPLTMSPLAMREAAANLPVPIHSVAGLSSREIASALFARPRRLQVLADESVA